LLTYFVLDGKYLTSNLVFDALLQRSEDLPVVLASANRSSRLGATQIKDLLVGEPDCGQWGVEEETWMGVGG